MHAFDHDADHPQLHLYKNLYVDLCTRKGTIPGRAPKCSPLRTRAECCCEVRELLQKRENNGTTDMASSS
jgi:hypothetical protein